ncbi:hypothetical protein PG999_001341 [Apiospora kogelbergensis]|uniref:Uncharacterized protein n=1 Tax=Apiospora kogelbergensis TaxID=1337665 RepID=A0AAW0RED6_9PEZI
MTVDPFSFAAIFAFLCNHPYALAVSMLFFAIGLFLGFTSAGFCFSLVEYRLLCPHGANCIHCALSKPPNVTAEVIRHAYAKSILAELEALSDSDEYTANRVNIAISKTNHDPVDISHAQRSQLIELESATRARRPRPPVGLSDDMRQWLDKYQDVTARVNDINDHAYGQDQNSNLRDVSAFPLRAYLLQYHNS